MKILLTRLFQNACVLYFPHEEHQDFFSNYHRRAFVKFGLEAEKFIFDMKELKPSESVFSILDTLSDYDRRIFQTFGDSKTTNEFVLSMVEFGTTPSDSPLQVLRDYLFNFLLIKDVAAREHVALAPLGALPMEYLPHMTPKRAYYIQNSILAGKRQNDWRMDFSSPLKAAGNCAGIHVHTEIETPHEHLYSNQELKNKFNLGLMLTPMIAFSSSPYFFSQHEAKSMRGIRYYQEVYRRFPLNGQLPPVMNSSMEVLEFSRRSGDFWIEAGEKLGFTREELHTQVSGKSANWNPVRWNHKWNTIEIRCLDSDFIDCDAFKFIWVCSAMRRMDLKGENLQVKVLDTKSAVDKSLIGEAFLVSGKELSILPTHAIRDIFERAMIFGTKDELVEAYLHQLGAFAQGGLVTGEGWLFKKLMSMLQKHDTTSEIILKMAQGQGYLSQAEATGLVKTLIEHQIEKVGALKEKAPDIFQLLEVPSGGPLHV
jgi:hypothetical protein